MAVIKPAYRVRPLDLGDILDEAFRIYRANFTLLFSVALVASIPALISAVGSGSGGLFGLLQQSLAASQGSTLSRPDTTLLPLVLVGAALGLVLFPITTVAPFFAASAVILGLPATAGSIVRDTFRNYWRIWGIGLIYILLTLTMVLILSIPLVIVILVRWSFKYQVLYLEQAGVTGSLNRSSALVKGSWWRVFGIQVLVGVIVLILAGVMGVMAGLISFIAPGGLPRQAFAGVLSTLVQTVLLPFSAVAVTLLYLDQRVRKESLDLQLMAGQVGQAEYAPPPGDLPPAGSDFPPPPGG
jgi:hypothetical protein